MIAPAPPPSFFPHRVQPFGDAVGFWPQTPLDRQESESASHPEFPLSKKRRHYKNEPSNLIQFPPSNPRIPLPNNPPVNKGINRMFFKTRMCEKFKQGTCPYVNNCNFAHRVEEIRKPPPNWKDIVAAHEDDRGAGNWAEQQRIINRLRICRKFFYGEGCPYGDKCNFIHEDPEKLRESAALTVCSANWSDYSEKNGVVNSVQDKKSSDGIVISVVDDNASSGVVNSTADNKPVYWKTKICNKWEMTGHCPFGEKCHFAHGLGELQKFGGGNMEADIVNVGVTPSKPLPVPANYISPSNMAASSCKLQMRGIKRFAKRNGPELISRAYADWIDNVQLLDSSPGRLKSEL